MKINKKIKKEIRILGIDDAPFNNLYNVTTDVLVVATVFRGGSYMDGLLSCHIKKDGADSTKKLIALIKKTKHLDQLQCIMINGIALGGFNVIDIQELSKKTKLPVIIIIRHKPNFNKIIKALKNADKRNASRKIELMKKAGTIYPLLLKNKKIYFQMANISKKRAQEIIKLSSTHGAIPEPLRIAHIIASGIVLGESHGRA